MQEELVRQAQQGDPEAFVRVGFPAEFVAVSDSPEKRIAAIGLRGTPRMPLRTNRGGRIVIRRTVAVLAPARGLCNS